MTQRFMISIIDSLPFLSRAPHPLGIGIILRRMLHFGLTAMDMARYLYISFFWWWWW